MLEELINFMIEQNIFCVMSQKKEQTVDYVTIFLKKKSTLAHYFGNFKRMSDLKDHNIKSREFQEYC